MEGELAQLRQYAEQGKLPFHAVKTIEDFIHCYLHAILPAKYDEGKKSLYEWLGLVIKQLKQPYAFEIFHQAIREPVDYYQFGLDFIRPLIDFPRSKLIGKEVLDQIQKQVLQQENVILLANHQTEPDPQIISLMLENNYPKLASDMIFVAGHRVTTDPLAVPMSLGRNLFCIYSKKHMDHPPEEKSAKIMHNQSTLKKMQEMLNLGGCCIYVAPSGGRDRPNAEGQAEVAPFDPDSLELFWLLGRKAKQPTHFYPLALKTYDLMPPPQRVEKELGEKRQASFTPVHLAFCPEIDMEHFQGDDAADKSAKRLARAEYICDMVKVAYAHF